MIPNFPYPKSNSIVQMEFFQDWEFAQNQLDTIGHNWIQLDSVFFQLILDLIGLDWTFSQLDKIGSNWTFIAKYNFQLEIYWQVKFTIGKN